MGQHEVEQHFDQEKLQAFMSAVLDDLRALEYMIEHDMIESGTNRVGAEQEMFLVDRDLRPAPLAMDVLAGITDSRVTTEIARFNLEANLTPRLIASNCFASMEQELNELLRKTRESAGQLDADLLLAGILPTLRLSDLKTDQPHVASLDFWVASLASSLSRETVARAALNEALRRNYPPAYRLASR